MRRRSQRHSIVPGAVDHSKDLLTALPPELVELISEQLGGQDLLHFRLTCRTTYALSRRAFNRRFIEERPFLLYDGRSIACLHQLITDPERRRFLKTIRLSLAIPRDREHDYEKRRLAAKKAGIENDRTHRSRMKEQRAQHGRLWAEQGAIRNGGAVKELKRATRMMRKHGIDVGIGITDVGFNMYEKSPESPSPRTHPEDPPAWGYDRLCDSFGYRKALDKRYFDNKLWNAVFDALYDTKHTPTTLELGNVWNAVPIPELTERWLEPRIADCPFSELRNLRLTVTLGLWLITRYSWSSISAEYYGHARRFLVYLAVALTFATKISTLAIAIGNRPYDDECLTPHLFTSLYDNGLLANLKTLELEGHAVNVYELAHFIQQRRWTLKVVRLRWTKGNPTTVARLKHLRHHEDGAKTSAMYRAFIISRFLRKDATLEWHHAFDGEARNWRESQDDSCY